MTSRRVALLALAAAAGGVGGALLSRGPAASAPVAQTRAFTVPLLAPSPVGALQVGRPARLPSARYETRWAKVRRPVVARARPRAGARALARLSRRTPEGTTNIVVALGRVRGRGGRLWVRVRLPVLPADTTGWVPRDALGGYGTVHTRLVVDRRRLTATLLRDGRRIFRARVGVGRPGAPTPRGHFWVRDRLTRYRSAYYGPVAFGTSARSPTLTDWPGGGFVGIHGTDRPDLLPGRVSHGCIRMRNRDMLRLARLMPVGTPVTVR
jgi:lipoprotein-anchoring transpeptidase ErfK/SrfK